MPWTSSTFNGRDHRPAAGCHQAQRQQAGLVVDTDFFFVAFTFTQVGVERNLSPILRKTLPSLKVDTRIWAPGGHPE